MAGLTRYEKRKYALALRRIDYGIWGHPISLFYVITLTTREGDDNTTERFGKDVKLLIRWIRKLGYKVEYCGVYELSDEKGLLHWHAILRVKGGYFKLYEGERRDDKHRWKGKDGTIYSKHINANRKALGDKWNELHNAFVVKIQPTISRAFLGKYINKHLVKDYLAEGVIRNKFLVSSGWMRKGVKELVVEFKHWWVNINNDIWVSNAGWALLKIIIRKWCEGKNIRVGNDNGYFDLSAGRITAEIYGSED